MTRLLSSFAEPQENHDPALRPLSLKEFVGQKQLMKNLSVFVQAARQRERAMDHVLFYGPPGLGKTTLAYIMAQELAVSITTTSGPVLTKPGDLASILTNLKPRDVLFIDEIHRLPIAVEEMLYAAMEDYKIDILIGEGAHARSIQLTVSPFTLVGATTRSGLLSSPLRDRFGILLPLSFYDVEDLEKILERAAEKSHLLLESGASLHIAKRCRGTPRIALRLLRRIRDFAEIQGVSPITSSLILSTLEELGINSEGLDLLDQKYLTWMAERFQGGPVGVDTLCAVFSETRDTLEEVIEPYLLQEGFIQRTSRGRVLTERGWDRAGKGNRTLI